MKRRVVLSRPAYSRPPVPRRVVPGVDGWERSPSIEGSPTQIPPGPVSKILEQAQCLTKVERQELLDHLALANQLTASAANNRDLDMWSEAVGIALGEAIGPEGGGGYGTLLIKRLLGSSACWRPVEAFMEASKLKQLRVVERQSIYLLLARLLVDHAAYVARRSGAPLSPKLVGACTTSLPGVFEQSFPGYLAAGLAPLIAKQQALA